MLPYIIGWNPFMSEPTLCVLKYSLNLKFFVVFELISSVLNEIVLTSTISADVTPASPHLMYSFLKLFPKYKEDHITNAIDDIASL
jgi:hypothetical protein